MKRLICLMALVASIASADTYVLYRADNGMVTAYDKKFDASRWEIKEDGTFRSGPKWEVTKRVLFTTNALPVANISQLTDKTEVDPLDLLNDYTQWTDKERKMLSLIVKELNILRVKAGLAARTKAQVISALKDE
jgi:hypothetical protein